MGQRRVQIGKDSRSADYQRHIEEKNELMGMTEHNLDSKKLRKPALPELIESLLANYVIDMAKTKIIEILYRFSERVLYCAQNKASSSFSILDPNISRYMEGNGSRITNALGCRGKGYKKFCPFV
ncbi:hypothetical protein BDA99DRAFT_542885 [Phascolomyces articulosus]|uniref:Uncharacterized protein n=1 Tax=Phascolomyces articulosus TaxID=60185 RepID=A0AAD5JNJ7_9FUNG|nr:hypothetical protein BDA99DRAFT_542885 [Phascolomyces articulosus]